MHRKICNKHEATRLSMEAIKDEVHDPLVTKLVHGKPPHINPLIADASTNIDTHSKPDHIA